MQIIILGMHRSGTSLLTRLINMAGAYVAPESAMLEHSYGKMSRNNVRGHWERRDVMDINDSILMQHNARWDAPVTSRPIAPDSIDEQTTNAIRLCLYGMDAHRPWVLKDPRLCLTLPCWSPYMEVPVVILMTRNPQEIAKSLNDRDGVPIARGIALWEYYMSQALNHTLEIPRVIVDHSHFMDRPQSSLETVLGWLADQGCRRLDMPGKKEISAFIDPALYRAQASEQSIGFQNSSQQQLWQILQGNAPQIGLIECSSDSKKLLARA